MNNLEYILVNNFKCKRCGCTTYDKQFFTGFNTLDEDDSVILERYICRNCEKPFDINDYKETNKYNMTSEELLKNMQGENKNE